MTRVVLSIDGGGVRGYLPARLLEYLLGEANNIRKQHAHPGLFFDLIAGTSTGGIVAAAMASRQGDGTTLISFAELKNLYKNATPKIFRSSILSQIRSATRPLFDNRLLSENLVKICRAARFSDVVTNIMIPAFDVMNQRTHIFRAGPGWRDGEESQFLLSDVLLSTTAAPVIFSSVVVAPVGTSRRRQHVDGGIVLNNPSLRALTEARRLFPADADDIVLLSLGTGTSQTYEERPSVEEWGALQWLNPMRRLPLLTLLMDAQAAEVDDHVSTLLWDSKRFIRLQPHFSGVVPGMDDASEAAFASMDTALDRLLETDRDRIDFVIRLLAQTAQE
ncbi:patatin-like phospholipase family protein [Mesorhizobium escarrei]|uniref:Patatin n=1 Tax=Mesorhizobium escarrei TaxID=666018 RepID=A0ABM9E8U1_9HYPH|nr:patatin-like phospholipase family protein [Mesorhizobium escarrei]CAH2405591.1 putative Patatin [Mesorhizobium escarrei]